MSDTSETPVVPTAESDQYLVALGELSDRADALGDTVEKRDKTRSRLTTTVLVVAVITAILSAFSLYGSILIHETQHSNGTILSDLAQVFDPHSQLNQKGAQNTNAIELSVEACDANTYLRISESQHNKNVVATHLGVIEAITAPLKDCAVSPLP